MARRGHQEEEAESDERWLLTYADMITLLMVLFMVLFSISSVNISKFEELQKSLKNSFSGGVVGGGQALKEAGGQSSDSKAFAPPLSSLMAAQGGAGHTKAAQAAETKDFERLKRKLDAYTVKHGLSGRVSVELTPDGLRIRLLTDKLLFASGSATPEAQATGLLREIGSMLAGEGKHPVRVTGHTDDQAIASAAFPSNWELSTARASAVVRVLSADGIVPWRLTATGRAALDPIAPNDTDGGRALNRRVEILLPTTVATPGRPSSSK